MLTGPYCFDLRPLHITRSIDQLEAQPKLAIIFNESSSFTLQMYTAWLQQVELHPLDLQLCYQKKPSSFWLAGGVC